MSIEDINEIPMGLRNSVDEIGYVGLIGSPDKIENVKPFSRSYEWGSSQIEVSNDYSMEMDLNHVDSKSGPLSFLYDDLGVTVTIFPVDNGLQSELALRASSKDDDSLRVGIDIIYGLGFRKRDCNIGYKKIKGGKHFASSISFCNQEGEKEFIDELFRKGVLLPKLVLDNPDVAHNLLSKARYAISDYSKEKGILDERERFEKSRKRAMKRLSKFRL